jgi:hypothetical protein
MPQAIFINPTNPVDQQVAYQQIARQQALADAMRSQSISPLQGGSVGGVAGYVSPLEGVAKIAQALSARVQQNRIDKRTRAVGIDAQNAQNALFGLPAQAGGTNDQSQPPGRSLGQRIGAALGLRSSGGGDQSSSGPAPLAAPPMAPNAAPPPMPQLAQMPAAATQQVAPPPQVEQQSQPMAAPPQDQQPQQAPGAPQPNAPYPMSLTGNAQQDMLSFRLNPEKYVEAVIASHAPTDGAKLYQQAAQAAAQGNVGLAASLYQQIAKNNYIPPNTFRGNSYSQDPITKVTTYHPALPEGSNATFGSDGSVISSSLAPGVVQAQQDISAAKSIGSAQGELVPLGTDANGQKIYGRKGDQLHAPGGQPPVPSTPGNGGPLNNRFGNGGGASPTDAPPRTASLADQAALSQQGTQAATDFKAVADAAAGSNDTAFALKRIQELAHGLNTGPGAGVANQAAGALNYLGRASGYGNVVNDENVSKIQEITKLVSNLAGQNSMALGGSRGATDAKLANSLASLPDAEKSPAAIKYMTNYIGAQSAALKVKGQVFAGFQQNDRTSTPQANAFWTKNYDPQFFQWMQAGGPANVAKEAAKLSPAARNTMLEKYRALKAAGAQF